MKLCWTRGFFASTVLLMGASFALAAGGLTAEQQKRNLESFDHIWTTIRDKHWDPKLGGLNWEAIRDELRPKVEQAKTTAEARDVMRDLIGRLKQSHFAVISADVYRDLETGGRSDRGDAGLEVRVLNGKATVVRVLDKSPAAKVGVRPGWQILRVRDQDLAPILEKVQKAYKDSSLLDFQLALAVATRLRGKAGDDLPVLFLNDKDKEVLAQITLTEPAGTAASFGHLPTFYVRFESRTLPGNIVYLSLNAFFDPARVMKELEEALKANPHAAGVIIDIRGNPGGIGLMAVGIGNWFVAKPDQKLGAMTTREATLNFVLNPRVETYKGPLAILVDGCSLSTSEIMAGGLQDLGRARVFGARTGGAALPSRIDRLPNGDGFQYPFANYTSVGGKVLEGAGVKPDVEVVPARKALLEGRDPALDAAVQWIKSQGQ